MSANLTNRLRLALGVAGGAGFIGVLHVWFWAIQNNSRMTPPWKRQELPHIAWLKRVFPALREYGTRPPEPMPRPAGKPVAAGKQ